jgi:iron complex outermembrane receptor protein
LIPTLLIAVLSFPLASVSAQAAIGSASPAAGELAPPPAVVVLPRPSAGAVPQAQQATGTIRGSVSLEGQGPLPGALVLLTDQGRSVRTDHDGNFVIDELAPGTYNVVVSRQGVGSVRQIVTVAAGQTVEIELVTRLEGRREEVTVTASAAGETTAFDAFNAVSSLDSVELSTDMSGTIGEVLENEPGLAKRGFGVGNARPIIRGFDGDRVLILDNGIRTGDLSSQSGDHGISIDPANVDRIEVVRGPATLLYGSNAIGGVVNAVTPDEVFRTTPHPGWQVNGTADGGSANGQLGGNLNFTYAENDWMVFGGGGSRKTDDYDTPEGTVENSQTDLSNARAGFGYNGERYFFGAGYKVEDGTFGVPEAGELHGHGHEGEAEAPEEEGEHEELFIDLEQRRQSLRFDFGLNELPGTFVDSMRVVLNAIDWHHQEIERVGAEREIGTEFDNRTYVARAEFDQSRERALHGKFGGWYQNRDYAATGEEALSPPVTQKALAGFLYEELDFERWRLQFGGRVEWNDYDPGPRPESAHDEEEEHVGEEPVGEEGEHGHEEEAPAVIPRSFTGASGSVGARFELADNYAFVGTVSSSYRAPALEELYNFGPHVGNLTFEIGNPDLGRERSTGIDLSLRHDGGLLRGSLNFFYYDINDYIFIELEDEEIDGLRVGEYAQGDSRFLGVDGNVHAQLHRHLAIDAGLSWVDAQLDDGTPLPRIPPLHGRIGIEVPYRGFRIEPEVILASEQDNTFVNEEPTAGYTVWNLGGSYTLVAGNAAHIFSVKGYNLSNELYFNHSSFIRIPEIGRGVKFGYALRLF